MGGTAMSALHVHAPSSVRYRIVGYCRRCKTEQRLIVTAFEWYGPMLDCCNCGMHVNDGELARKRITDASRAQEFAIEWETLPERANTVFPWRSPREEGKQHE